MRVLGVIAVIVAGITCLGIVVAGLLAKYVVPDEGEKR